ncbi:DUF771 domain-containing protein [Lacticaseibacillus parakribbianus]|uniref:DUF771 domain-containing protein n=1 Tax=Lacticaseibacillus parakribbianus TaxID=2970927 RepID=UPI0021CB17AB|nr:DUF771 domain-containing protein [Lacticaseibacillus parakribbianus]
MPPITISVPPELIQQAVDKAVAERLQHEPDYRRWWSAADVLDRYGLTQTWLSTHVLDKPRFQRELDGFAFNYGGRIGWRFEPLAFSEFMRTEFRSIAKEAQS